MVSELSSIAGHLSGVAEKCFFGIKTHTFGVINAECGSNEKVKEKYRLKKLKFLNTGGQSVFSITLSFKSNKETGFSNKCEWG